MGSIVESEDGILGYEKRASEFVEAFKGILDSYWNIGVGVLENVGIEEFGGYWSIRCVLNKISG